jgi:hyperosmotically inducible periplasmic protein
MSPLLLSHLVLPLLASLASSGARSDAMRRLLPFLLAVSAVPAFHHRAYAQTSDRNLFERVAEAVRTSPHYGVFDGIDVEVRDRAVTLSGRVTNTKKKQEIEKRVQKIDGLGSLTSGIGVLPLSPADDELRYRVAQSIYNNPMFWTHGQRPVPPIHIVVERGRVTLTGVANSDVERSTAASLAQVSGSVEVTNRITLGKR